MQNKTGLSDKLNCIKTRFRKKRSKKRFQLRFKKVRLAFNVYNYYTLILSRAVARQKTLPNV